MTAETLYIGGASGFWGDSGISTPQLLRDGRVHYIVYDYLAEITMSVLARARSQDPALGYATDFVHGVLRQHLRAMAVQGVKVIANAGGVNPLACADAVRNLLAESGIAMKVAVVTGDDLLPKTAKLADRNFMEMFSGSGFPAPDSVRSINAYLGAFPIAKALAAGADIVITGRCVDSALVLGPCIHHFGWQADEWDKLAGGSLAGHILECGTQATGGNHTDWGKLDGNFHNIGYPIAEIRADGSFVCTKAKDTAGLVSIGTVAEQLVYEIGDPQAYVLPDVVCDFSQVTLRDVGPDRVDVTGARGRPAPDSYKVSLTYSDGFRGGSIITFYGMEADRKAKAYANSVLARCRTLLTQAKLADFTETCVELMGAESHYGASTRITGSREVDLKLAARHVDKKGIDILLRETVGLGLSGPPGLTGFAGARPKTSPVVGLFSFLLPKSDVDIGIVTDDGTEAYKDNLGQPVKMANRPAAPPQPKRTGDMVTVPLVRLAWGRSGDKGDKANIGIIARHPDYFSYICAALTEDAVAAVFAHFLKGDVTRYLLPGLPALNFVLDQVLAGGGTRSLRSDPQGKGYAQVLLEFAVPISAAVLNDSTSANTSHETLFHAH